MTATLLSISSTPDRPAGLALICSEARYASVLYRGADRLDRRFGTPATWRAIETDQRTGLPATPLDRDWTDVTLLLGLEVRAGAAVQYVTTRDVGVPAIGGAEALDAELRAQTHSFK